MTLYTKAKSLRFSGYDENPIFDWNKYQIKDACDLFTGFPFKGEKYVEVGKFRVLRGDNVKSGFIKWDEKTKCWNELSGKLEDYLLENNDLIIGMDGSKVGRNRAIVTEDDLPLLLAQRVACLRSNESFYQNFIKQIIYADKFTRYVDSVKTGTSIFHISKKQIADYKFNAPSYDEQKKIADFLEIIDKKIELLKKKQDEYLNFKKYLMQQIFAQKLRFENGCSWNECTLGSIGETYNGLSGLSKDNFEKGNSRYITYKSIFDNNILIEDLTENVELNNKTQNNVKKGDLFFTGSSETPEEVGMVSVLTFDIDDCYLNSFCFGYRLKDTKTINPLFLAYYLRSPIMRNKIQILAQGSTRFNLSKKEILKLKIEIPSITEQLKIIDLLQNTDKLINNVSNQINEINLFKKSLLQQMFVYIRIKFLISVRKSVALNIV